MMLRANVISNPSPNFKKTEVKRRVICVVIHCTATDSIKSPLSWLCNPESKVSAHYLIDRDGTIYGLVDESDIAWHCGISEYKEEKYVNNFSVGIELVNKNDGKMDYPEKQIESCAEICSQICRDYHLTEHDIVGHNQVSPGRKTDPLCFPWVKLVKAVSGKMLAMGGQ